MSTARPPLDEIPAFYRGYVEEAPGVDVCDALVRAADAVQAAFGAVPEARGDHRYAPGKWTVKEVLLHLIDAERVFAYRTLRFARRDATPLPGFDEDAWVPAARAARRTLAELLAEHRAVHAATLALFRSFEEEDLLQRGTANGNAISVRAIGWATAGHALHHVAVLRERYLG
ncbi:MAG: DinB family protein [Flavobacteriales bacterium]|nr:DinB family protein [Flavobacteriales bacterium]